MALNEKESRVLSEIKKDPYISQKDLAEAVHLSRSSVANIISFLVQKGYLFGRAYVVNDTRPVVCIGAFNLDNYFNLKDDPIEGISTNTKSYIGVGGMARNVAENLGRLNVPTSLLSVVGQDASGKILKEASHPFMNLDGVEEIADCVSGNYTEIHDKNGVLMIAMAEIEIFSQMTPDWLKKNQEILDQAEVIVVDTNTPKESIELLLQFSRRMNIPLKLICTAAPSLKNLPDSLKGVDALIVRSDDTSYHFGYEMQTDEQLKIGIQAWKEKGIESVLMIKDEKTILHGSIEEGYTVYTNCFKHNNPKQQKYPWGMEEALCAGLIYGKFIHKSRAESVEYGCVNSFLTARMEETINPELTQHTLEKKVKKYRKTVNKKIC